MNKMYEYLKNHAYISYNKKSTYEFELSEERAECIANKYDSLTDELQQENQELKEQNKKEFADYIKFKKEQYDEYLEKVNKFIKENQELKKQLENNSKINVADHKYASTCEDKVIILETQQKEFIKYLEDEIKELQKIKETELDYDFLQDVISQLLVCKDVLQKYKEIIGEDKK